MLDLHRHDEFSTFDGFGKANELSMIAKEKGLKAIGVSNHGNVNGLVEHYLACMKNGIKPILGVECYYQPKFDKDAPKYHLCLFAKNLEGYRSLNRIITDANTENFFYKATVTFDLLKKYSNGIICTSACIGGYVSSKIVQKDYKEAFKEIKRFKDLFGDDYYIEIMPYTLPERNLQERVNEKLMIMAGKADVKCILTSDSHYGSEEDFDTYVKMHEIRGNKSEEKRLEAVAFAQQYKERYIPAKMDLYKRFVRMHGDKEAGKQMYQNMKELIEKVDDDIFGQIQDNKIIFDESIDADKELIQQIKKGLRKRGKATKKYLQRAKEEYKIIKMHGFSDYFLIVQDYVQWAKKNDIAVGPGRGSVCNSIVAYALGITDVDSIYFDLEFTRFLRADKKKMPDIDLDFETSKRQRVIDYIIQKYKGRSAQICSYGLYKVDNALNDLFKVCGVTDKDDKEEMKNVVRKFIDTEKDLDVEGLKAHSIYDKMNEKYDDILKHFSKMYKKVRFIGTHAAGVGIVGTDILDYTAIEKRGDRFGCAYDLSNLEKLHVLKFDMLGLTTMSELKDLEDMTGQKFDESWLDDSEVYEQFRQGNTDGIFQFERHTVKDMLISMEADCFNDIIAANAMNRPGPLSLGMPQQYAENKLSRKAKKGALYKYAKDTYGTIIYQEQITAICRELGNYTGAQTDTLLKIMKSHGANSSDYERRNAQHDLRKVFVTNATSNGMSKKEANNIFDSMLIYAFNKGHATGYALIAAQMMWYKVHYPEQFWLVKLRYAGKESDIIKYKINAVKSGSIILLPHVNGTAQFSIRNFYGSDCLQEGLSNIKNVGKVASKIIEEERLANGDYTSYGDLVKRVPKRYLNNKVLNALEEAGAVEFKTKVYVARTEKYNAALYGR